MRPFQDLTGSRENLAIEHRRIAKAYTNSVLSKLREVLGVVLVGGAARGYADKLSEIDMAIFVARDGVKKLPKGEHRWRGYLLDNDLYIYGREAAADWSQERRQAFYEGKILLDRKGLVRSLLRRKLKFRASERRRIILENLLFLEDRIEDAETIWPRRGHIPSAHYAVNMGVEKLFKILFAYNSRFLPSEKWRFYYSCHLPWLPRKYQELIIQIMKAQAITYADLKRRVANLKRLDVAMRNKLRKENMLPIDVYRYCVERIWTSEICYSKD
jgi:predicted nucleotidyltransferase